MATAEQRADTWHHVVLSHSRRDPIAIDEGERLRAVRSIVRIAGPWLVVWCVVDDHLHIAASCDRRRAGLIARNISQSLGVPLSPAWVKKVEGRKYRRWLVDYVLLQPARHGVSSRAALWSGSCFLDLVGARWLPGYRPALLRAGLPRLRLRELFDALGLGTETLRLASDERTRRLGAEGLVAASFAALGVAPTEGERSRLQVLARALACSSAREVGLRLPDMASALGLHRSAAPRLASRTLPAEARAALRKRVALEDRALAARAHDGHMQAGHTQAGLGWHP